MSKFSERCKAYLEDSGITLYKCSQKSGIERTTLYRMVNGRRLPPKEVLISFCDYLRLDNNSRDDLIELYNEEKIGTVRFQNRKFIQMLLEYMANIELNNSSKSNVFFDSYYKFNIPSHIKGVAPSPKKTTTYFQTKTLIHQLLSYTFSQNKKQILFTNLPHTFETFFNDVQTLFFMNTDKKVIIYHLFTFLSSPGHTSHVNYNLEILFHILPLALSPYEDYQPYYTYTSCAIHDIDFVPWNYYLVTDDYAFTISADMATGILHFDSEIIETYQHRVKQIKKRMSPLLNPIPLLGQACDYYHYFTSQLGNPIFSMEYTPCVSFLFPPSRLSELMNYLTSDILKDENKELLNEMLKTLISSAQKDTTHIISEQGLSYFMENGKLLGQGAYYFPSFSMKDRKKALEKFLSHVRKKNNFICFRSNFIVPQNIYIELYGNNFILFLLFRPDMQMKFCYIQESSLYEAFYDFMDSLPETNSTLNNEELIALLEYYLETT